MKENELFQLALNLEYPWIVQEITFDAEKHRLDIEIDFESGSNLPCPECKAKSKVYDTVQKEWRHLNFFQHETYLHARVPRVQCEEHGVRLADVPWARKQSGFTLLFEALVLTMAGQMPVKSIAALFGVTDKRLWRILEHHVNKELENQDLSGVTKVGIDETASRRGHNYVSLFVDLDQRKVVFVEEGKDSGTIKAFSEHLQAHNGNPDKISEVTSDMSPAFISGVQDNLPNASLTFDKFHVMKLLNKAIDDIRKEERKKQPLLKSTRYSWLKNPSNLTASQEAVIQSLSKLNLKTARAYRMKLAFQEIYSLRSVLGISGMQKWHKWAIRSRLKPIIEFAKTLQRHWDGVVRWFESGLTNAILEGLNSLVQAAKARARGYRTSKNLKIMIYLIAGKIGRLSI
jgi:transposase